jgi:hypothetical protein
MAEDEASARLHVLTMTLGTLRLRRFSEGMRRHIRDICLHRCDGHIYRESKTISKSLIAVLTRDILSRRSWYYDSSYQP